MKKINNILIVLSILTSLTAFGQSKTIKVIEINDIKYYHVYKVLDLTTVTKDTLLFLGCKKNNTDFKEIKLDLQKQYNITTQFIYPVKISDDEYLFSKPGVNIIDYIRISQKGNLPVLITDYEPVISGKK